jgi:hypothetical protein
MKTELFKKVYIKSESDLPKEDGAYFCHYKQYGENSTHFTKTNLARVYTRETEIDWYLLPIQEPVMPTDELKNELIKFVAWIIKDEETPTDPDIWISADTVDDYLKSQIQSK